MGHYPPENAYPGGQCGALATAIPGLMGEPIHAQLMKLERTYSGIRDDLQSLQYIMTEQSLYSAPRLSDLRPPPKRRKIDVDSDNSSDDDSPDG